ncbi:MAG: outer membrane protein assembly factor [Bacteroidetes bacterium]|nr:outer membrane protein assembly factor [Bacteroidota bacterium]
MRRFFLRFCVVAIVILASTISLFAQDTTRPSSVDPKLLEWENAKIVKEYTIGGIEISGVKHLDSSIVLSISSLQVGDKFNHPGSDIFSKAINNLWRQKLFSDIQIFVTRIEGNKVYLELNVRELPRLANYKFIGIKKSEVEDLQGKIQLARQTIISENTRRRIKEETTKFFANKGFQNVQVTIVEKPDTVYSNSNSLIIYVDKGKKVRISDVSFYGNTNVDEQKLKKKMKGTKEMSRITLYPPKDSSRFGIRKSLDFKEYVKDWGFLSLSKTKLLLDPYFRFKLFSSAKFDPKKFEEDEDKVLNYYNSLGYRDAQIIDTAISKNSDGNLNIAIKVSEGHKYYFGNISWKGNSKYPDTLLNAILGINKGDIYNVDILNKRLGKQASEEGGDIGSLYMDDGYLFYRAEAVETAVYNDTIDHEIRIVEGPQARIKNVTIAGNDKTKDYVVRRELSTIPGNLFSRADLIRSSRDLGQLQYFNQESINPGVVPNAEDGTVDINWKLEEKSSDQLELSAGWGGGIGLTGTLGVSFNNFSIHNIFKKSAWDPLPQGDGQKLSLRIQSNGRAFRSYSFSFTEPWLGGKKRNSLTIAYNNSKYSNAFDPFTGTISKALSDSNYLKANSFTFSLGKQLKWPDDYFSLVYTLNFTQYKLKNYPIFQNLSNGVSNNFNLRIALQRSSAGPSPIYPTNGSNFLASLQVTPPYSLLNPNLIDSRNPYKFPEYHKWRFNEEWYIALTKPIGIEHNKMLVIKLAAKYGFL